MEYCDCLTANLRAASPVPELVPVPAPVPVPALAPAPEPYELVGDAAVEIDLLPFAVVVVDDVLELELAPEPALEQPELVRAVVAVAACIVPVASEGLPFVPVSFVASEHQPCRPPSLEQQQQQLAVVAVAVVEADELVAV